MDKTRTRVVEVCTPSHLNHIVAFYMSIDTHASIIFFLIETCINYYTLDTMFNGFNWSKTSLNSIINNKFCAILTVCVLVRFYFQQFIRTVHHLSYQIWTLELKANSWDLIHNICRSLLHIFFTVLLTVGDKNACNLVFDLYF